jgi:hypothetical protein
MELSIRQYNLNQHSLSKVLTKDFTGPNIEKEKAPQVNRHHPRPKELTDLLTKDRSTLRTRRTAEMIGRLLAVNGI